MKITEKENMLLRRALDPASSPNEAEAAMAAFARSLRKRGINGYDFVPPDREARPQGPQARPSNTPQPPEPPKAEPPPPYQQTYAERVYKEASKPEPTEWTQPPERKANFVPCLATWLGWFGFFIMVALILQHSAAVRAAVPRDHIELTGPGPGPRPIWVPPYNSRTDPLDWSGMSHEQGMRLWKRLPLGTWVRGSKGNGFQKT